MGQANQKVEVVVHIDNALEEESRDQIASRISEEDGIFSFDFCPQRHHLVLVQYDRTRLTSQDILHKVKGQNLCAQLVGPI